MADSPNPFGLTSLWVRNLGEGVITLWYGLLANIPTGFVLCDGENGTPDLQKKFLVGAGAGYNPDDTGGSRLDYHTGTTDGHGHRLTVGNAIEANEPNELLEDSTSHITDTFTTMPADHRPQWHALMYIMET